MLKEKEGVYYRKWAVKNPKIIILAVHGMGAHSGRWEAFAKFMNKNKISVYAPELPGHGEIAGDKPGQVKNLDVYEKIVVKLLDIMKKENKGAKAVLCGESMGGLIAHLTMLDYSPDFAGLIEVVPVYKDVMKISLAKRIKIAITSIFNPSYTVQMPYTVKDLTHAADTVKKLEKDKREHRLACAGLLISILLGQLKAISNPSGIKIPVLFLVAGMDNLGDSKFTLKFFEKLKADKECKYYENDYHSLTIEKNKEEIFKDMLSWIKKKIK